MPRQVIEDKYVSNTIDNACRISSGLRDAWDALVWLLARRAEIGADLGLERNVRIHKQQGVYRRNIPEITVLYEYNEHSVFIRAVELRWE